jgi:hypothetical protein
MKKIVSFGDSFIFGNELKDHKSWVNQIANTLKVNYQTLAEAGCGNRAIEYQVYNYFSSNPITDTLVVINWTWSVRWDFFIHGSQTLITLGPTCQPDKLKNQLGLLEAGRLINFYKDYTSHENNWSQFNTLTSIWSVQNFLKMHNIPSVQTYMDYEIFLKRNNGDKIEHYNSFKDPSWPNVETLAELEKLPEHIKKEVNDDYERIIVSPGVGLLQDLTYPHMLDFEGLNFLDWSKLKGYSISPEPYNHPLDDAHSAAAFFWCDHYNDLLNQL